MLEMLVKERSLLNMNRSSYRDEVVAYAVSMRLL